MVHGLSRLLAEPEFQTVQELRPLMELIDERPGALVGAGQQARVWIGDEHPQTALQRGLQHALRDGLPPAEIRAASAVQRKELQLSPRDLDVLKDGQSR